MGFFLLHATTLIGFFISVLLLVFFIVACISVERTKNESIRTRELLENINKLVIAYYKRDFLPSNDNNASNNSDNDNNVEKENM